MKEETNLTALFTTLLVVVGLSISTLWWIIGHAVLFSDGKNTEYYIIPLLLGILLTPVEVNRCKKHSQNPPWRFLKLQLVIGLLGVIIADILIYLTMNAIGPAGLNLQNPAYVNSTRWLSSDVYVSQLLGLWCAFEFLCILPAICCMVIFQTNKVAVYQTSWHCAWVVLGILLGVRVGGSWSGIFYQLIYLLILFPVIVFLLQDAKFQAAQNLEVSIPLIPLLAMLFLAGFWFSVIEAQQAPSLSGSYMWFLPAIYHGVALILFKFDPQKGGVENLLKKKGIILGIWVVAEISIALLSLINLFMFFTQIRQLWLVLATIGSAVLMEILILLTQPKPCKFGLWVLFGMVWFVLGLLIPYLISIFDPISTYVMIGLIGINFLCTVPFILKKKTDEKKS